MQGASPHDNAVATAKLIQAHSHMETEVCLGVYRGQREVSLKIMGFDSKADAINMAQSIIEHFGQECVLLVDEKNAAYSVTARGIAWVGTASRSVTNPQEVGADCFTQFMDGTYMVAGYSASFALAA